jgi:hypothetical protein
MEIPSSIQIARLPKLILHSKKTAAFSDREGGRSCAKIVLGPESACAPPLNCARGVCWFKEETLRDRPLIVFEDSKPDAHYVKTADENGRRWGGPTKPAGCRNDPPEVAAVFLVPQKLFSRNLEKKIDLLCKSVC